MVLYGKRMYNTSNSAVHACTICFFFSYNYPGSNIYTLFNKAQVFGQSFTCIV